MPSVTRRGPGRPPAAKSAETRGRIMRAAREVFGELGYDGATFQEIALRADLTRPAINHYFRSKLALYRTVVEDTNAIVIDAGIEKARAESSLDARVRAFIQTALRAQVADGSVAGFLITSILESQRHPQLSKEPNGPLQEARGFASWVISEAVAAGELPAALDVEPTAEMLVAMMLGLATYAGYVGSQQQLIAITEQFLQMLSGALHTE